MKKKLGQVGFIAMFAVVFTIAFVVVVTLIPQYETELNAMFYFVIGFFAFIVFLIWCALITSIVGLIRNIQVEKKGKEYTANFVSHASNTSVNNVKRYRIIYAWKDDLGRVHEGRTSDHYTIDEAELFKRAKTFKIKAIGKRSTIVEHPSRLVIEEGSGGEQLKVTCRYCGTIYESGQDKCPSCGASTSRQK